MALLQVEKWTPVEVGSWLKGLEDSVRHYVDEFIKRGINGKKLLLLDPGDLESLGIWKIGHQEVILSAVDILRRTNFGFERETLQLLFLELGTKCNCLAKELDVRLEVLRKDHRHSQVQNRAGDKVATATISAVDDVLMSLKRVLTWLDSTPFNKVKSLNSDVKPRFLKIGMELATTAQRDSFAEDPENCIRTLVRNLAVECENIVQNSTESLLIQTGLVEVVTIKKRGAGTAQASPGGGAAAVDSSALKLGIVIQSSYIGVHTVGEIRAGSPAFTSRRLEEGNEILQVNYQTVVGWQNSKVRALVEDGAAGSAGDSVVLTLRKPPRHYPGEPNANNRGIRSKSPTSMTYRYGGRTRHGLGVGYGVGFGHEIRSLVQPHQYLSGTTGGRYRYARTEPRRRSRKDEATTASAGSTGSGGSAGSGGPSRKNSSKAARGSSESHAKPNRSNSNSSISTTASSEVGSKARPRDQGSQNSQEQEVPQITIGLSVPAPVPAPASSSASPAPSAVASAASASSHNQRKADEDSSGVLRPRQITRRATLTGGATVQPSPPTRPRVGERGTSLRSRMGRTSSEPPPPPPFHPPPPPPPHAHQPSTSPPPPPLPPKGARVSVDFVAIRRRAEDKENKTTTGAGETATAPKPLPRSKRPVPAERTTFLARGSSEKRPKAPPLSEAGRKMRSSDDDNWPQPPPVPHRGSVSLTGTPSTSSERIPNWSMGGRRRSGMGGQSTGVKFLSGEDEYRDGSAEKLWQGSLRNSDYANQTASAGQFIHEGGPGRPISATNKQYFYQHQTRGQLQVQQQQQQSNQLQGHAHAHAQHQKQLEMRKARAGSEPVSGVQVQGSLKRAALYQPPPMRGLSTSAMKAAFEMSLDSARAATSNPTRTSSKKYPSESPKRRSGQRGPEYMPIKTTIDVDSLMGVRQRSPSEQAPVPLPRPSVPVPNSEGSSPVHRPYSPGSLFYNEPSTKI